MTRHLSVVHACIAMQPLRESIKASFELVAAMFLLGRSQPINKRS